jgi:hypothetical protein
MRRPATGALPAPLDGWRKTGVAAVLAAGLLASAAAANGRDPWLWPFSVGSPWNTPIGDGARFSADDSAATRDLLAGHALIHAGTWSMPLYLAAPDDRMVTVRDEENARVFHARVPAAARPDPMGDGHMFVVEPGRGFVLEMYRARVMADGSIVARRAFRVDLRGPGMFLRDGKFPGVRAMDASGFGGVMRAWEMRAGRIGHALTFLLPPSRLKHGPVWPSAREDFWGGRDYAGHIPIGTLIAIPGSVRVDRLGLSAAGLVLARALQDFGAYCDDSVGSDGLVLSAEAAAEGMPELAAMRRDFPVLRQRLRVVENNGPQTVGGGGRRRAPPAPELVP